MSAEPQEPQNPSRREYAVEFLEPSRQRAVIGEGNETLVRVPCVIEDALKGLSSEVRS